MRRKGNSILWAWVKEAGTKCRRLKATWWPENVVLKSNGLIWQNLLSKVDLFVNFAHVKIKAYYLLLLQPSKHEVFLFCYFRASKIRSYSYLVCIYNRKSPRLWSNFILNFSHLYNRIKKSTRKSCRTLYCSFLQLVLLLPVPRRLTRLTNEHLKKCR
jgi:hypothetical protein